MIDDETLMAYADNELDPAQRRSVERAAAADPATAKRLMDHVALRNRMAAAFAEVLDDPVPARLKASASGGEPFGAAVIDLAAARAARTPKPKRSWPIGGAIAACLAVGLLAGAGLETLRPAPIISGRGGALVADGALAKALSTQLASNQTGGQPIKIGLSFRTASGDYCRTFRVDRETAVAGVACRDPQAWSVKMAMATAPEHPAGGYRTASSDTPPAITQLVETLSAGEPLNAQDEAVAKSRGWLNHPH
jgi:hypothetical protein